MENEKALRLKQICENAFNLDMISKSRKRVYINARSSFAYHARKHLGLTFREIGEVLGGKDHATALHAINNYETYYKYDGYKVEHDEVSSKVPTIPELKIFNPIEWRDRYIRRLKALVRNGIENKGN